MLTDTHCHIHEVGYDGAEQAYDYALTQGITAMICVGTNESSSRAALEFANKHTKAWASVGVHPHDTIGGYDGVGKLADTVDSNLVAIGEIGLDYFYDHSPRAVQAAALEAQLQIAKSKNLPVILHVREAFDDFWPILHNFPGTRGVLHSFTDTEQNMERALKEGLYIGVNGISTFTKDISQCQMFDRVPLESMLLETDSPFLTPTPYRGKVNQPAFVKHVAEYHANRREVELEHLARVTSVNASNLFSLS